jgi:hypothetical protein
MLGEDLEDPEAFLEELFPAWYVLPSALRHLETQRMALTRPMA